GRSRCCRKARRPCRRPRPSRSERDGRAGVPVIAPATRWPETRATRGLVAAPHHLASRAGVAVMGAGGNALDAAIAAGAAIAVVYPHMNGIGGDNVWLIYDAERSALHALCACGRSARAASISWYAARGLRDAIPAR